MFFLLERLLRLHQTDEREVLDERAESYGDLAVRLWFQ